ncbi:hypothetical protein PtA15_4A617 [Puccinia triticina]|uniref:Uncharacterized protein n=1 Tax=Puccinia triticina TaxID=208348 RepID=A0ABY7CHC9_9BASI|nr:uncharacterized protein PtA15_4A617 [Puccinia triticina]WAQ84165.1 hypothetical protein PtA15_4A617 [Puccinia triticina]
MRRSPAPQNNGKPPKFSTAALLGAPRTKFIQNNIIGVNPNTTPQKPPRQQFWAAKFQEVSRPKTVINNNNNVFVPPKAEGAEFS